MEGGGGLLANHVAVHSSGAYSSAAQSGVRLTVRNVLWSESDVAP